MLQYGAVCCSVLQCDVISRLVPFVVWPPRAVSCAVASDVEVQVRCCSVMQCAAVC